MSKLDQYLHAATRENTRLSYQGAVRHFEVAWAGYLPATADSIARYLADHAETLSISTLRQRLAALARWHVDQGFPDPTKAPVVRQVLRGIVALHPPQQKQARPLQLEQLEQAVRWLDDARKQAAALHDRPALLRHTRNKSLLLLGFWRGFRADELTRLAIEHVTVAPGEGMACHFPRTKGDRRLEGTTFRVPALARLCPVEAYLDWIELARLSSGPVFRGIDRWGHVGPSGLHVDTLTPLLRSILTAAGIAGVERYSGHSIRRGFATWATANGWDLKTLMEYVGWKNMQSALRYVEPGDAFGRRRLQQALDHYTGTSSSEA